MAERDVDYEIEHLMGQMSLKEKISLIAGAGSETFETKAVERLGIPPLKMTDGPLGIRWGRSIAFPCGIAMASTWNPDLVKEVGKALALEAASKGRNVILGPCVNIARVPHNGRTFEGFGEDPCLASKIAVAYIKGVQSEGVVATVKHFACYNQEYERKVLDVEVDERALNEIYLPAFKAAVEEGGVWGVMSAYNKVNGCYCSENKYLLQKKLKDEWNFKGVVISDWGSVHSVIPTVNSGLDIEMPEGVHLNFRSIGRALASGAVQLVTIDDKVKRILRVVLWLGLLNSEGSKTIVLEEAKRRDIAYKTACEGIVLLKNENRVLPLDVRKIKSVAVVGPNATEIRLGGGSSMVSPSYSVSPLDALRSRLKGVTIYYEMGVHLAGDVVPADSSYLYVDEKSEAVHGLLGEYFDNVNLEGSPVVVRVDRSINFDWGYSIPADGLPSENYSVRWSGYIKVDEDGEYILEVISDDGVRVFLEDELVVDDWTAHMARYSSCKAYLATGKKYKIRLEYFQAKGDAVIKFGWIRPVENFVSHAVEAARKADVVIVFAGTSGFFETEGKDRESLDLPCQQDSLIESISEVNKNVIVVLINGSPLLMYKWVDRVKAVLEAWFAGSEAGNAIADVLIGAQNPSGKLPITFPKKWSDCSAFSSYKAEHGHTVYSEGLFVGYRHFDKNDIEPLFPFGHGLSYTEFVYSNLVINSLAPFNPFPLRISFLVRNAGDLEGAEVCQVYISKPESRVIRPIKELKAFRKVRLRAGEKQLVEIILDRDAFCYFDEMNKVWEIEQGEYRIMVGSSSRDVRLYGTFVYNGG